MIAKYNLIQGMLILMLTSSLDLIDYVIGAKYGRSMWHAIIEAETLNVARDCTP